MRTKKEIAAVWKELYDAALAFHDLSPWDYVSGSEMIGVRNPQDGMTAYCVVLGGLGEVYGLSAYLGPHGFELVQRIHKDEIHSVIDVLDLRDFLLAEFVLGEEMEEVDKKLLRQFGDRIEPDKRAPTFRRGTPGHVPWPIDEADAAFLAACLKCATLYLTTYDGRIESGPGAIPVFVQQGTGERITWKPLIERTPELRGPAFAKLLPVARDVEPLSRLNKLAGAAWEADFFYVPRAVENDKGAPYFPRVVLVCEQASGAVLAIELFEPEEDIPLSMSRVISAALSKYQHRPSNIRFSNGALPAALADYLALAGIGFSVSDRLPRVLEAKESFLQRFSEESKFVC